MGQITNAPTAKSLRTIYEDEQYKFSAHDFGTGGQDGEASVYVFHNATKQWARINKITTRDAVLGRAPDMDKAMLAVGWDHAGLTNQPYTALPLRTSGSVMLPDKIEFDNERGIYRLVLGSTYGEHSHPTILYLRRDDLDAFFAGKLKPAGPAAERAAQLKANLDQFRFSLWGVGAWDGKHANLTFAVPADAPADHSPFEGAGQQWENETRTVVRISKEQAAKIIDHLEEEGFLDRAEKVTRIDRRLAGPAMALSVYGPDRYFDLLGWLPPMRQRLTALRQVLDGDAAKAMDKFLDGLAPASEPVQQTLGRLRDRLQFLAPDQTCQVTVQTVTNATGQLTSGVVRHASDAGGIRVDVQVSADRRSVTRELTAGDIHWDGQSTWRGYGLNAKWHAVVQVEGNRPETLRQVNAIIDQELVVLQEVLQARRSSVVAVELVQALADRNQQRRTEAATTLRFLLAHNASAAPNRRDQKVWEQQLALIKPGMTEAEALKILLPDATPAEREKAKVGGGWSGGGGSSVCRLDDYWTVTFPLVDFEKPKLNGAPGLTPSVRSVWVQPPANYTGQWTTYFVNGQPAHAIEYRAGKYHGTFTAFNDNGSKAYRQHYVDGVGHGTDTGWHRNGRKSYEGEYDNGKQVGTWRWWDEAGKVTSAKTFTEPTP